jgi:Spy/CpxP family protein refolding chaperone
MRFPSGFHPDFNQHGAFWNGFTFLYTRLTHADMEMLSDIPQVERSKLIRSKQMNKSIITVITALLLAASGMAMAQDYDRGPGNKGKHPQRGMQAPPQSPVQGVMRAIRRLDLSDEQKEAVWNIAHDLKGQLHPVMVEMRDGQRQLKDLLRSGEFDAKAVAALAEKEGDLVAQRIMLTSEALAGIFDQLTEEQKSQLAAMAEKRKQRAKSERGKKRRPKPAPEEG